MPRISTTVDGELDRRLRAEAERRRIPRARLLREAALYYLGVADGAGELETLRVTVAAQAERLQRLERQLGAHPRRSGPAAADIGRGPDTPAGELGRRPGA